MELVIERHIRWSTMTGSTQQLQVVHQRQFPNQVAFCYCSQQLALRCFFAEDEELRRFFIDGEVNMASPFFGFRSSLCLFYSPWTPP